MNGPNKLECYIILGLNVCQGQNALAYKAHSYVTTKKSILNTASGEHVFIVILCRYAECFYVECHGATYWQDSSKRNLSS